MISHLVQILTDVPERSRKSVNDITRKNAQNNKKSPFVILYQMWGTLGMHARRDTLTEAPPPIKKERKKNIDR